MLRTRLKAVYYYGELDPNQPAPTGEMIELRVTPGVDIVVKESLDLLPDTLRSGQLSPTSQCYEPVGVEDFLVSMQGNQSGYG